ncbi:MAG: D-glycerate dehydrogenase [Halanaerobium sp.]|nr:D-glycerate dehydrogenase [Halanaerobium sp.]
MKVFVTRRIPEKGLELLAGKYTVEVWPEETAPPKEALIEKVREAQGLVSLLSDPVDREVIEAGSELKVIANYAVGYDNIDIAAASRHGIQVTNTPGVLTDATADLAFALLMSTARRIVEADHYTRAGMWKGWGPKLMLGQEVSGSSLGIIGLGRIGAAMAKRGAGFGMDLYYTSRSPHPEVEAELGITRLELEELLQNCDFISLHCPLTEETEGLIGEQELKLMKEDAILVNTARGKVVDQDALYRALKEGWIAGAGLDVFDPEPLPAGHPILKLDNVVVAPHIGSAGSRTREKMAEMVAKDVISVLEGRQPENPVN